MIEKIEKYLDNKEWKFECNGEDIATAFTTETKQGEELSFPLYFMTVDDPYGTSYVRLIIVPFIDQPESGFPDSLWKNILLINHDLNQMKFALDADGDLELTIDIPADAVEDSILDKALSNLADTASTYIEEIKGL